ncbi:MAG TPA: DMT family transporter, partial [Arenibaculum sp.]|nr:DMT family transporter [Arenibaculum sp.]
MSRTGANLLLLLTAVIWGSAFVAQRTGMDHLGPMAFTAARFLVGGLCVLPLAIGRLRRGAGMGRPGAMGWFAMAATGGALFAGAALQQVGIGLTSVTNAAFLTGLYVPLVPLLGLFVLRRFPHPIVWPAAAGCLFGTWLLSGAGTVALSQGDWWVIAGAGFWAAHVLLVGAVSTRTGEPTIVAAVQFLVCAALAGIFAAATETTALADLRMAWREIAYAGVLSVGLAFTFQAVAQRWTAPWDAAIILSSEMVFAALAGAVFLAERPTPVELSGCAVILACILVVQVVPMRRIAAVPAE